MQSLRVLGLVYFCYLFLFSGLEFTLSFLTHQRFQFTRYELKDKAVYSEFPFKSDKQQPYVFLSNSMEQGKMFFFIGVIMALIQGGYARRIKPGQHIRAVRMVKSPTACMANTDLMPLLVLMEQDKSLHKCLPY